VKSLHDYRGIFRASKKRWWRAVYSPQAKPLGEAVCRAFAEMHRAYAMEGMPFGWHEHFEDIDTFEGSDGRSHWQILGLRLMSVTDAYRMTRGFTP